MDLCGTNLANRKKGNLIVLCKKIKEAVFSRSYLGTYLNYQQNTERGIIIFYPWSPKTKKSVTKAASAYSLHSVRMYFYFEENFYKIPLVLGSSNL